MGGCAASLRCQLLLATWLGSELLQDQVPSADLVLSVCCVFYNSLPRSLSVPYAYQCCAFWGCDSYANLNTEDNSPQDHSVTKEKGKCVHPNRELPKTSIDHDASHACRKFSQPSKMIVLNRSEGN